MTTATIQFISLMLAVLGGQAFVYFQLNGRIDRLSDRLDGKIDSVAAQLNGKIDRVAEQLTGRIDRIGDDLKQFYQTLGKHEAEIDNLKAPHKP